MNLFLTSIIQRLKDELVDLIDVCVHIHLDVRQMDSLSVVFTHDLERFV